MCSSDLECRYLPERIQGSKALAVRPDVGPRDVLDLERKACERVGRLHDQAAAALRRYQSRDRLRARRAPLRALVLGANG